MLRICWSLMSFIRCFQYARFSFPACPASFLFLEAGASALPNGVASQRNQVTHHLLNQIGFTSESKLTVLPSSVAVCISFLLFFAASLVASFNASLACNEKAPKEGDGENWMKNQFQAPKKSQAELVGGWTNPFEKYARQNGNESPQFSGWK